MKEINIKLSINELKLIDYCLMQCLINSRQETKLKQQVKILIAKLRRITTGEQNNSLKARVR